MSVEGEWGTQVDPLVQKLDTRTGLLTIAEVMKTAKMRLQMDWIAAAMHV
jgi:hypothetical protein